MESCPALVKKEKVMCSCDIERPDYDQETGEQFWLEFERVARKDIKCSECSHLIKKGENHKYFRGRWEGEWRTYKICLSCISLGERFFKETDCCHPLGGLHEELINSDILNFDEETEEWIEGEDWIKVVCQEPLKCEIS